MDKPGFEPRSLIHQENVILFRGTDRRTNSEFSHISKFLTINFKKKNHGKDSGIDIPSQESKPIKK